MYLGSAFLLRVGCTRAPFSPLWGIVPLSMSMKSYQTLLNGHCCWICCHHPLRRHQRFWHLNLMLKLTLVAFLSLSELFEECLVMGDKLPIEFHSDVLWSCNLGDDAVFRIVKLHGYCSSLIKILSSGTKGCGLVCCFLSANYLAFYLHVVFFFALPLLW